MSVRSRIAKFTEMFAVNSGNEPKPTKHGKRASKRKTKFSQEKRKKSIKNHTNILFLHSTLGPPNSCRARTLSLSSFFWFYSFRFVLFRNDSFFNIWMHQKAFGNRRLFVCFVWKKGRDCIHRTGACILPRNEANKLCLQFRCFLWFCR